jgi:hypothetical protein
MKQLHNISVSQANNNFVMRYNNTTTYISHVSAFMPYQGTSEHPK